MDWFIQIALVFIAAIAYFLSKMTPKNFPPGPRPLPLIGNLHQLGTRSFQTLLRMKSQYGNVIGIHVANYRAVVLNDPKVIREALSMSECSGRMELFTFRARGNGNGLKGIAFNNVNPAIELRRFALKTFRDFGFGKKSLEGVIQEEVKELIQRLSELNGKPFHPQSSFNLAVVNVLWTIVAGERFAYDDKKLQEVVKLIVDMLADIPASGIFLTSEWLCKLAPNLTGFTSFLKSQDTLFQLVRQQYEEHLATFQPGQLRDYLDGHIQEILDCKNPNSAFYKEEGELNLLMAMIDLFGAASETTSTTLSWAFLYLSINPAIQHKLFTEIKQVAGLSRLPSLNDRLEMPYSEATIMEVQRMASVTPFGVPHSTIETIKFHDYIIPKNTFILPNIYAVQHDPEIWGDPENFRPERFINAEGALTRNYEGFMPFAVGKRVCLGESLARDELFLFLTSLIQKFRIEPNPDKTRPDPNDYKFSIFILLQNKTNEYILHERN